MNYVAIQSFDLDRIWWRLFQNRVMRTNFDTDVFTCIFVIFIYIWISIKTSGFKRKYVSIFNDT